MKDLSSICKKSFPYNGVDAKMRPHIDQIFDGEYDIPGFEPDRPTILDIGANVGGFTFWAVNRFKASRIYAYEPIPDNFIAFKQNILDPGPRTTINLFTSAIVDSLWFTVNVYLSAFNCGAHSTDPRLAGQAGETKTATVIRPQDLPEADILKVDTEGCEVEIITGYLESHPSPEVISYEYHRVQDRETLRNLLSYSYDLISHHYATAVRGTMNWKKRPLKETA